MSCGGAKEIPRGRQAKQRRKTKVSASRESFLRPISTSKELTGKDKNDIIHELNSIVFIDELESRLRDRGLLDDDGDLRTTAITAVDTLRNVSGRESFRGKSFIDLESSQDTESLRDSIVYHTDLDTYLDNIGVRIGTYSKEGGYGGSGTPSRLRWATFRFSWTGYNIVSSGGYGIEYDQTTLSTAFSSGSENLPTVPDSPSDLLSDIETAIGRSLSNGDGDVVYIEYNPVQGSGGGTASHTPAFLGTSEVAGNSFVFGYNNLQAFQPTKTRSKTPITDWEASTTVTFASGDSGTGNHYVQDTFPPTLTCYLRENSNELQGVAGRAVSSFSGNLMQADVMVMVLTGDGK